MNALKLIDLLLKILPAQSSDQSYIFLFLGGPDVIERVNLLLHVCVNVYHEARDKIGNVNMLQAVQYGQAMKHKQVTQSDFPIFVV